MDWKQKLSSRKLWACVVGVLMGAAMFFGVDGDTVSSVAGAVTSLISVVAYIITEGKIDAAAVNTAYEDITDIVDAVLDALGDEKEAVSDGVSVQGVAEALTKTLTDAKVGDSE